MDKYEELIFEVIEISEVDVITGSADPATYEMPMDTQNSQ